MSQLVNEIVACLVRSNPKLTIDVPELEAVLSETVLDAERWRWWCDLVLENGWARMIARHTEPPFDKPEWKELAPDITTKAGLDLSIDRARTSEDETTDRHSEDKLNRLIDLVRRT